MMAANDYQVGGKHYVSSYIHWDWCLAIGLPYLEGNASRYLVRLGKKGSVKEDLEKTLHYIVKLEENVELCIRAIHRPPRRWVAQQTERFIVANNLDGEVGTTIRILATWETVNDLRNAQRLVKGLIDQCILECAGDGVLPAEPSNVPMSVPLEDSNKHADRSDSE
jgi:hypothetical protein